MKYNKLVRDKIPEIIKENGKIPKVHTASDGEYLAKLKEKLQEEVGEFLKDGNPEELADILEAIYAIKDFKFEKEDLEAIRKSKEEERGGFKKRIILDEVT
ncbi:hypothetical protein A3K73_03940 [Candidatus Pacearchaeota archaeon RBG_13_36_9]|nr:MAG: hypothetical protein A3K73_03940 [Candidatus Pacearchaeota archaeon RBG_13_36_9]